MAKTLHPWAVDHPVTSPFAFPEGVLGSLAGRFMHWTYDDREIVDLLRLEASHRVLEVGFGAGGLLQRIDASGVARIVGVDPSERMLRDASRRNRAAIEAGRMTLSHGTASCTGQPDASFDRVVSVHSVALWPKLELGVVELARIIAPGGMVLLAWHGGQALPWTVRNLRLPGAKLDRIEAALAEHFSSVERIQAKRDDVFRAYA